MNNNLSWFSDNDNINNANTRPEQKDENQEINQIIEIPSRIKGIVSINDLMNLTCYFSKRKIYEELAKKVKAKNTYSKKIIKNSKANLDVISDEISMLKNDDIIANQNKINAKRNETQEEIRKINQEEKKIKQNKREMKLLYDILEIVLNQKKQEQIIIIQEEKKIAQNKREMELLSEEWKIILKSIDNQGKKIFEALERILNSIDYQKSLD